MRYKKKVSSKINNIPQVKSEKTQKLIKKIIPDDK